MAFNRRTESISLGVQDDDKQMVCCDLRLGCWCGDTIALMEYDRRRGDGWTEGDGKSGDVLHKSYYHHISYVVVLFTFMWFNYRP